MIFTVQPQIFNVAIQSAAHKGITLESKNAILNDFKKNIFLKILNVISSYAKENTTKQKGFYYITKKEQKSYFLTITMFIIVNLILGVMSQPIIELIKEGLHNFV